MKAPMNIAIPPFYGATHAEEKPTQLALEKKTAKQS